MNEILPGTMESQGNLGPVLHHLRYPNMPLFWIIYHKGAHSLLCLTVIAYKRSNSLAGIASISQDRCQFDADFVIRH